MASDGSGGGCRCLHLAAQQALRCAAARLENVPLLQGFYDCIQLLVSARANPSAEMRRGLGRVQAIFEYEKCDSQLLLHDCISRQGGGFASLALAARSGHAECSGPGV